MRNMLKSPLSGLRCTLQFEAEAAAVVQVVRMRSYQDPTGMPEGRHPQHLSVIQWLEFSFTTRLRALVTLRHYALPV